MREGLKNPSPARLNSKTQMFKKSILVSAIVALVVSVGFQFLSPEQKSSVLGGLVELQDKVFVNGFRVGTSETRVMDGSGNFTIPGTLTVTGDSNFDVLIQSGGVLTIASGSTTFTAAQICDNTLVRHDLSGGPASAQNFKLPTAAAMIADCIPDPGDVKMLVIENNSNNAGEILTFVAGTGFDIGVASASSTGPGTQKNKLDATQRSIVIITNLNDASVSFDHFKMVDGD